MSTIDKLALVLIRNRRVLYVRSKGKDLFYNLGGKREGSESDVEALTREVREELTLEINPRTVKYMQTFTAQAHGKPEGTLVSITCYEAVATGEPTPGHEIEELAWCSSADHARTTITGQLILTWLHEKGLID